MSPPLLMTRLGKQPGRYVMLNLIPRDMITKLFKESFDDAKSALMLKRVLLQMNGMCKN